MSPPRLLVTGAAGFIGSHVAARLAGLGHRVAACDNFNAYYDPALKRARVEALLAPRNIACAEVELADEEAVTRLFETERPDIVIHLAAQAGVRHSIEHPQSYVQANLVAFGHLLEACRHRGVRHLVYASSSSVYGASEETPFREEQRTDAPISLYAATKKANEAMAHAYSHLYGFRATGLRFFTVYGPWGRPDMAYFSFAEKIVAGQPLPVFAEGRLLRDFTFIDDIVEGVVRLALAAPPAGAPAHEIFNIGNHQPVTVLQFVEVLAQVLGRPAAMEFLPMQPGDVPVTCADASRLRERVGFEPATPLAQGMRSFVDWFLRWRSQNAAAAGAPASENRGEHRT